MDSTWNPSMVTDDTEWVQDNHHFRNTDYMSLDPMGLQNIFSGAWEDVIAEMGHLGCAEEPLLSENLTEGLPTDLVAMQRSFDLLFAGDNEFDDGYGQIAQSSSPFDFSSPECSYGRVRETGTTNGADGGAPDAVAVIGREAVPEVPGENYGTQLPWKQGIASGTETRGRPRKTSIEMVCRAGEVSSMKRSARSVQKSDSSWDEQDRLENFCDSMKRRLDEIEDSNSNTEKYFITSYLNRKKRRLVHALAHLRRFNHMTLDETRERRILVTAATIRCKANDPLNKCWNERKSQWKLDPKALVIMFSHNVEPHRLHGILTDMNLPPPHSCYQIAHSPNNRLFLAEFDTAGAAARVIDRLHTEYPMDHSNPDSDTCIDASYRYWSQEATADATFKVFGDKSTQQSWSLSDKILFLPHRDHQHAKSSKYPPLAYRYDWSRPFNRRSISRGASSRATDSDGGDGYGSGRSRSSSKRPFIELEAERSQRTHLSVNSGNVELYNQIEGSSRDASADSAAKRRKRHPKKENGYPCTICEKQFHYFGERTKHALIHKPKDEHPYACDYCERRFINVKDLRRHEKVHLARTISGIRGEDGCQTD